MQPLNVHIFLLQFKLLVAKSHELFFEVVIHAAIFLIFINEIRHGSIDLLTRYSLHIVFPEHSATIWHVHRDSSVSSEIINIFLRGSRRVEGKLVPLIAVRNIKKLPEGGQRLQWHVVKKRYRQRNVLVGEDRRIAYDGFAKEHAQGQQDDWYQQLQNIRQLLSRL